MFPKWTVFAGVFLVVFLALSQSSEGKLQCPDKYCVMCLIPPNKTAEQVYGKRCLVSKDCTSADHLCCRRDNFGSFCTKGVDDLPRAGQCPPTVPLPLGDRVSRCPADMGNLCSFDADCPLDRKCCRTSCGYKECTATAAAAAAGSPKPSAGSSVGAAAGGARSSSTRASAPAPTTGSRQPTVRQPTVRPPTAADGSLAGAIAGQKGTGQRSSSEIRRTVLEMLRAKVALLTQKIQMWKDKALRLRQMLGNKATSAAAGAATPSAPAAAAAGRRR